MQPFSIQYPSNFRIFFSITFYSYHSCHDNDIFVEKSFTEDGKILDFKKFLAGSLIKCFISFSGENMLKLSDYYFLCNKFLEI